MCDTFFITFSTLKNAFLVLMKVAYFTSMLATLRLKLDVEGFKKTQNATRLATVQSEICVIYVMLVAANAASTGDRR